MAHPLTPTVTNVLSILVMAGQAYIVVALLSLAIKPLREKLVNFMGGKAVIFSLIVAAVSMLGSLFYSNIAGLAPCVLCWYQRIAMYPQVLLFAVAFWKKDRTIIDYTLGLSGIGAVIAVYHYYVQLGGSPLTPCSTVGYSVSCSDKFIMNYGYITIPMMALTGFLMIMVNMFLYKQYLRRQVTKVVVTETVTAII